MDGKRERFSPYGLFQGIFVPWELVQSGLTPGACFLYSRLTALDGKRRGFVWPRQSTIARDLRVSQRTVERHLRELRDAGLISIERRGTRNGRVGLSAKIVFHRPRWRSRGGGTDPPFLSGQSSSDPTVLAGQSRRGLKDARARLLTKNLQMETRSAARGGSAPRRGPIFTDRGSSKTRERAGKLISGLAAKLTMGGKGA